MNPYSFRQYDIRGHADRDLSGDFALNLGRALGTFWTREGRRQVALGRDCRLSSPRLHAGLVEGLMQAGLVIIDLGLIPTPTMYFAVFHLELDGGVMITGSHNPGEDNGFKMMKGRGSLYGEDIVRLREMIEAEDFDLADPPGTARPSGRERGSVRSQNMLPAYLGFLEGNIQLGSRPLRFAIDAGNGAAGPTASAAMNALGLKPIELLCEMDGTFPNHHPDPTVEKNLQLLIDTVRENDLDFGIAFDGDGDRIGVVDGNGEILWGDKLLTVLSRDLLKRRPGAAILGEVKCSQLLYDDIALHGGRPIMWKTGHSLIKAKMAKEGALLAGEMSGHIFFKDRFYGFDDAVYVALRLIELLSDGGPPLHERISDLPKTVITPELRVPCPDDRKFAVVQAVREHFRGTHEVNEVDGARIRFGEGEWGLVRASNTGPVLVLRFEAKTDADLQKYRAAVESVVERALAE